MFAVGRDRSRFLILLALTLVSALYPFVPRFVGATSEVTFWWSAVGWLLAPALSIFSCLYAAKRSRGTDATGWRLYAVACLLAAAAVALWASSYEGFSVLGDGAFLGCSGCVIVATYLYGLDARLNARIQFTNLVLILGSVTVSGFFLVAPDLDLSRTVAAQTLMAFLFPMAWAGIAVFGLISLCIYAPGRKAAPFLLVLVALSLQALGTSLYGLQFMRLGSSTPSDFGGLWVLSFVLLGWAAVEHARSAGTGHDPPPQAMTERRRFAEAFVPAMALSIVCIAGVLRGAIDNGPIFLVALPVMLLLALLLGLREYWALSIERRLRATASETSRELSRVLESTSDSVAVVDREWRIVYFNQHALELFRDLPDLKIGSILWELFPEAVGTEFERQYNRAFETQSAVDFEEYLPQIDGWLSVHAVPDGDKLSIFFRDVTARRRVLEELQHLAQRDPLTGLSNRAQFRRVLIETVSNRHNGRLVAVLALDLDHFKEVNDTRGHIFGDSVLLAVAQRVSATVGKSGEVGRMGGDEFSVLLSEILSEDEAVALAKRLTEVIAVPYEIEGVTVHLGLSVGIALSETGADRADDLLKKADIALYEAKAGGRGAYKVFDARMEEELSERQNLKASLAAALERAELEVFFQPIVNLQEQRVEALEALVRWPHREKGYIPPSLFIPLAEQTGMITPLAEWMLEAACKEAAGWPDHLRVAVNVSACEFRTGDLAAKVERVLQETGLAPHRLELEITEYVLLQEIEANRHTLARLRDLGVQIGLDDFGTGYSSLSYIRNFSFTNIKIDRSFVSALDHGDGADAIVRAIVQMAEGLGLTTTAEGIETPEQLAAVRRHGCTLGQGYLFSRPVPRSEVATTLSQLEARLQECFSTSEAAAKRAVAV